MVRLIIKEPGGDMREKISAVGVILAFAVVAVGCSSTDSANAVGIVATDSECRVAQTDFTSGTQSFKVDNQGDKVTEVYVYGDGDKVITEKENIGPGTSATFSADLTAGKYEIACKPGQTGKGIRQEITVSGAPAKAAPVADRTVTLDAVDYSFTGTDQIAVNTGQTIEFRMTNRGTVEHEFEVLKPDGDALGEIGPTTVGEEGNVTLTFVDSGSYRYVCGITDHEALGMAGTFVVQ
jgi:uncharacterized cupredoxin-like copper-binding protein